jgi:hypothetical protein
MAALFAVLSAVKDGEVTEAEAVKRLSRSPHLPERLYAQVGTSYRRRHIIGVKHRVIFGTTEIIESLVATRGWKIKTAVIERLHLDFRQHVVAIGRRVNTLCKQEAGWRQQRALLQTYHHLVLAHTSLRLPLPEVDATSETGSITRWRPQTPARAAGLPDRVWRLRDVLMSRVPPWPQPLAHAALSAPDDPDGPQGQLVNARPSCVA